MFSPGLPVLPYEHDDEKRLRRLSRRRKRPAQWFCITLLTRILHEHRESRLNSQPLLRRFGASGIAVAIARVSSSISERETAGIAGIAIARGWNKLHPIESSFAAIIRVNDQ